MGIHNAIKTFKRQTQMCKSDLLRPVCIDFPVSLIPRLTLFTLLLPCRRILWHLFVRIRTWFPRFALSFAALMHMPIPILIIIVIMIVMMPSSSRPASPRFATPRAYQSCSIIIISVAVRIIVGR